jgi:hypothetical protein
MAHQLRHELAEQGDPRITGEAGPLDERPTAAREGGNFYARFLNGRLPVPGWINPSDIQDP